MFRRLRSRTRVGIQPPANAPDSLLIVFNEFGRASANDGPRSSLDTSGFLCFPVDEASSTSRELAQVVEGEVDFRLGKLINKFVAQLSEETNQLGFVGISPRCWYGLG